jgi:FixJ family two-component response regulator
VSTPAAQSAAPRKIVVVIDDDPDMLKGIQRLLAAHNFGVEAFGSVEDFRAGAHLREAMCLVIDIHLKKSSGIELRKELAISGFVPPVIFITADDSEATRNAALKAGCVDFLMKPFSSQALLGAIAKACASNKMDLS